MSLLSNVINWFSTSTIFNWFRTNTNNPTKQPRRTPQSVDWTDSLQVNKTLTKGLYHNSYPGMKLAGSMCYTPIAVPVWFMGLPIPKLKEEDEELQEILSGIVEDFADQLYKNHTQIHRDGTLWIWPSYSAKEKRLVWEIIEDDTVSDIIRDIRTREITEIITDEEITITTGYNQTATVRRKRSFTKKKITVEWKATGGISADLKDRSQRNVLGILPIPFSNNADADDVRGHSDYERIVTDLKDYHDIDLKRSLLLAKFDPKMVQEVQDVSQWLKNNGYDAIKDINIATTDLIFNLYEQEKTSFVFPERATEAYNEALKGKFRKIVEGSGIPEILWGTRVTGNLASAELQVGLVVNLVKDKRNQKNRSYKKLFDASLRLLLLAGMSERAYSEFDIEIDWNDLDAVTEETKSKIFKNFSEGVATLIQSAGATKEQLWKLWKDIYPGVTEDEIEDFTRGLDQTARLNQYKDAPFEIVTDLDGSAPIE